MSRGRQGFEDLEAHHRADVGVLDQDDLALGCRRSGWSWCVAPFAVLEPEDLVDEDDGDAAGRVSRG